MRALPTRQTNRVTIYEPNYIMKAGILVWPEMFRELADFRGHIWRLVVRDLSTRYKQSALGIFCAFLAPLIMMLLFVWIKGRNILPAGDTAMPYAAFVFLGQMVWLLFACGTISLHHANWPGGSWSEISVSSTVRLYSDKGIN